MPSATQYYESIKPDREAWRASMPAVCMDCGVHQRHAPRKFLEIHEILPRSYLPKRWGDRCLYLLLCRTCHDRQHARNRDSMIRCLAIKSLRDPLHYDLKRFLELRNPIAMDYISQNEVNQAVKELNELNRAHAETVE